MTSWSLKRGGLAATITFACLLYWFAFANRYTIFLYGHVDRAGDSAAIAFDALTRTRYVMASLTAAGYGAVAEVAVALWARSRWARPKLPGDAVEDAGRWRRYVPTAMVLAAAVTVLVGQVNFPTLPPDLALAVGAAAAAGFGLAMWCRHVVDGQWRRLVWLIADGAGPAMVVLGWRVIELPERGTVDQISARVAAAGVVIGAVVWGAVVARVRAQAVGAPPRSVLRVLAAGACVTLLAFPVLHHLHTPGEHRYITAAQNVGGYHLRTWVQAVVIAVALAVGAGVGVGRQAGSAVYRSGEVSSTVAASRRAG